MVTYCCDCARWNAFRNLSSGLLLSCLEVCAIYPSFSIICDVLMKSASQANSISHAVIGLWHDMHSLLPLLTVLVVMPFPFNDATPLVIPWNTTHSYGPDGPWPVITVQVGSSDVAGTQRLSIVDLHPGGIWESMILRGSFCNSNGTNFGDGSSQCLAEKAGLYKLSQSTTAQQNFTDEVGLVWQWGSSSVDNVSGEALNVLDTMTVPALQGAFTINNSTISAVHAWQIEMPDGTYYSAQVGTLSLGAPGMGIQQFNATVTGQTAPGSAYAQGATASNSWGLHYGSASLSQEGSLVFGGYDQSRALGEMGAFDLSAGSAMMANLLDVQIGAENGSSPFKESSYTGLLKLNASFGGVQPTVINPIVPYLFMSPETCAAVTENLPVTFDSQVGLYIWNATDPRYERIVNSPAYLAFVFQNAGIGNLTIKVSFRLLNLTLEAPIMNPTQQYFPCRPFYASDHSGDYFLGKAFLQAAFIGMNWQMEKFFLAQAPGPGVGASNITPIGPTDVRISTDPIENYAVTWARDWAALSGNSDTGNSKNTTANSTGAAHGQNGTSGHGMSSKTKTGIAVGAVIGVLAVAGVLLLSYLRRGRTAVPSPPPQEKDASQVQDIRVVELDVRTGLYEVGQGLSHEADADDEIYELGVLQASVQGEEMGGEGFERGGVVVGRWDGEVGGHGW